MRERRRYAGVWFLLGMLILGCSMFLNGCKKNVSEKAEETKEEGKQERKVINGFEEIKHQMPEGLAWIPALGVGMTKQEELIVFGAIEEEDNYFAWTSQDYGETWGEPVAAPVEFKPVISKEDDTAPGTTTISAATVSPDGEIALIRTVYTDEFNSENTYWLWTPGEEPRQILIELEMDEAYKTQSVKNAEERIAFTKPNRLEKWKYTEDGTLISVAMNRQLFVIDPEKGEILAETPYIHEGKRIEYFGVLRNNILVQTAEGVMSYDVGTGEFVETDAGFQQDMLGFMNTGQYTYVGNLYEIVDNAEEIFQVGKSGIYRGTGKSRTPIIPGEEAVIGKQMTVFLGCFINSKNDYIIPYVENGEYGVLEYRYTGETSEKKQERELKIYSLKENDNLAWAIEMFREKNAGISIEFETGLSEEGGITVSDAIRKLTTSIMAGDGPDVILLDGMPVESYIEKGVLTDVTDIYTQVNETEGLLENIAGAYKKGDKIYAISTHFYAPVLLGQKDLIEKIHNLDSLKQQSVQCAADGHEIAAGLTVQGILDFTMATSARTWIEEGKINKQNLESYLKDIKEIIEASGTDINNQVVQGIMDDFREDYLRPIFYANEREPFTFGMAKGFGDVSQMNVALNTVEGSWKLLGGQAEKIFVPSAVAGISGRAQNLEAAKEFVEYLLSSDIQKKGVRSGFPVNKAAAELMMEEETKAEVVYLSQSDAKTGNQLELEVKAADIETLRAFYKDIQTLNVPELTDQTVTGTVKEYALSYVKGEISLQQAMKDIESRVNLYLAE